MRGGNNLSAPHLFCLIYRLYYNYIKYYTFLALFMNQKMWGTKSSSPHFFFIRRWATSDPELSQAFLDQCNTRDRIHSDVSRL